MSPRVLQFFFLAVLMKVTLLAQPNRTYRIDTVAGITAVTDGVAAVAVIIDSINGLAATPDGSFYLGVGVDGVRKVWKDGSYTRVPGIQSAPLLASDPSGILYYLDSQSGQAYFTVDPATSVIVRHTVPSPFRINRFAPIAGGAIAFVVPSKHQVVFASADGTTRILSGPGSIYGGVLNGTPDQIVADRGTYFVSQTDGTIVQLGTSGYPSLVFGDGTYGKPNVGGPATKSGIGFLGGFAVNAIGEIYIVDTAYQMIVKVNTRGILEYVGATTLPNGFRPYLAFDDGGNLLIGDYSAGTVSRVNSDGTQRVLAGASRFRGDGGPAIQSMLNKPSSITVDQDGKVTLSDDGNFRIRQIDLKGMISTVAGNGSNIYVDETGPALNIALPSPNNLTLGNDGSLYFLPAPYATNYSYGFVRRISPDGILSRFAGSDNVVYYGDDGPAISAYIDHPTGLGTDHRQNVYISHNSFYYSGRGRIRSVTPDGVIHTVLGGGSKGDAENIPATSATVAGSASRLVFDSTGISAFYESGLDRIRRIDQKGIVATWASTSPLGKPGNAAANACDFYYGVGGIAFDNDDSLLISSSYDSGVVCRLMPDGTSWLVAGGTSIGFAGDGGPSTSALLNYSQGIAVDRAGPIYIADTGNHRIRRLRPDIQGPAVVGTPIIRSLSGGGASIDAVTRVSPGGLSSLYGTNFAPPDTFAIVQGSDLYEGSLPIKLANTCVEIGGFRAFLTFVGTGQINFQVPAVPANTTVTARVVANCGTSSETKSSPWTVTTATATPEFLYWTHNTSGRNPVIAVNAVTGAYIGAPGNSFISAKPGDILTIYCVSLGPTNPAIAPGDAATGIAPLRDIPTVTLGGIVLTDVLYVGATPTVAGLYQINLRVPALPDGDHTLTIGNSPTDGFLSIRN